MSLETLLEAAEYLEWRNKPKTRGDSISEDKHGSLNRNANDSDDSPESSTSGKYADGDEKEWKRRPGGAGTRETHNKLEKNRRAHLKECFDYLKKQIPTLEDKRTSNLGILRGSLRYIQALRRKEKEYEFEMQRLAREKICLQERLASLKGELSRLNIEVDLDHWKVEPDEMDSNSTSTATEQGSPICSEEDNEELPGRGPYKMYTTGQLKRSPTKGTIHLTRPDVTTTSNDMPKVTVTPVPEKPKIEVQTIYNPNSTNSSGSTGSKVSKGTIYNPNPNSTNSSGSTGSKVSKGMVRQYIPLHTFPARTPVTQILAQTLNQRQMLQRQQKAATATTVVSTSAVKPVPVGVTPRSSFTFTPLNNQLTNPSAQLQAISKMAGAGLTIPMTTFQMQAVAKGTAETQPVMVSTNPSTTSLNQSQAILSGLIPAIYTNPLTLAAGLLPVVTTVKTSLAQTTTAVSTVASTQPTKSAPQQPQQQPLANMRPVFTPHFIPGHIPLNAFLAQSMARTSVGSLLTTAATPSTVLTTSANQGSSSLQLMSLAQMTPGTQLLSPMSPLQLGAAGFTQAQINQTQAQISQMLLKQIPILTPNLLQAGQSMLQPMVKPLVVVSVPNVVTTTSLATTTVITKPSTTS